MKNLKLYNLDRQQSACFGGMPSEHDFSHVYDLDQMSENPITKQMQPKLVYFGTLKKCHEFMASQA